MGSKFYVDIQPAPSRRGVQRGEYPTLSRAGATVTDSASSMDLLFIVHSGNPADQTGDYDHRREINRRAQRNAIVRRKQARRAILRPVQDHPSRDPVRQNQDDTEIDSNLRRWPESTCLTTTIDPSQDYHAPSVRSYLDSLKVDPFRTGSVSLTPQMEGVLMHYFTVLLPVIEPTQAEREDYSQWMVPLAVEEPALLYALVACMAHDVEQASVSGFGPNSRRNATLERTMYRIKAIQALNECLTNPKSAAKPSTLLAVHFLLWQEIFSGDESVHLDGVQRLLELRGGFGGVQRKAIEGVMLGCFWRAIRTRTKPTLPAIVSSLEISEEKLADVLLKCDPNLARTGEGFFDPDVQQHFDDEMIQLLRDARMTWICFEQIGVHDFTIAEKRHFTINRSNIDHRLLSYPFDHHGDYRPIQEACRQALVTFSSAHYNVVQPSSKIARCLIEDLKTALEATDLRSYWGTAWKALTWVLFQGAHLSFGQRERHWFVTALTKVAQVQKLRGWIQVRALLGRFYYTDRVFQESFRKIWDEVGSVAEMLQNWS